jgi:hypothetical protein
MVQAWVMARELSGESAMIKRALGVIGALDDR